MIGNTFFMPVVSPTLSLVTLPSSYFLRGGARSIIVRFANGFSTRV